LRDWENLGLLQPDCALAVYHLIDAIDQFNAVIGPRDEIYAGAAVKMLIEIVSKAEHASKVFTDEAEKQ